MVRILHALPGRLRLRFAALKGHLDLASRLHRRLDGVSHMRRVEVDTRKRFSRLGMGGRAADRLGLGGTP